MTGMSAPLTATDSAPSPSSTGIPEGRHMSIVEVQRTLEVAAGALLVGVDFNQRGVHVDHQLRDVAAGSPARRQRLPRQLAPGQPGPLPRHGPGGTQRSQPGRINRVQHPPRGRRRRDRAVQQLLIGEYPQVGDRLRAVRDRDGQIDQHPTRVMPTRPATSARHRLTERSSQTEPVRHLPEQHRTHMRHDPDAVRRHHRVHPRACNLHVESAFPYGDSDLRQAQFPLQDRHFRYLTPRVAKRSWKSQARMFAALTGDGSCPKWTPVASGSGTAKFIEAWMCCRAMARGGVGQDAQPPVCSFPTGEGHDDPRTTAGAAWRDPSPARRCWWHRPQWPARAIDTDPSATRCCSRPGSRPQPPLVPRPRSPRCL
jgi:hypothetical protein